MRRKKRLTLKLIAVGFAAAAVAAPSAQAKPDPGDNFTRPGTVSADNPRPAHRATPSRANFDFGAWYRRHWRNIPE